jgi:hypothetical protein
VAGEFGGGRFLDRHEHLSGNATYQDLRTCQCEVAPATEALRRREVPPSPLFLRTLEFSWRKRAANKGVIAYPSLSLQARKCPIRALSFASSERMENRGDRIEGAVEKNRRSGVPSPVDFAKEYGRTGKENSEFRCFLRIDFRLSLD